MSASEVNAIQEFWRSSESKLDQKFYAAYSIFSSAILDHAVARHLQLKLVYDWSIIAYYYSMLHSMRLISFIALGDFPIRHKDIIGLFKNREWRWSPRGSWVIEKLEAPIDITGENLVIEFHTRELDPELSEEIVECLGEVMEEAKEIRESINYEGLLIVHQFWHYYLTPKLEEAVNLMQQTSSIFLRKAIKAFTAFIEKSERRGEKWVSFILFEGSYNEKSWNLGPDTNYGMNRLIGILNRKYRINDEILDNVMDFLKPIYSLRQKYAIDEKSAREVLDNISISLFKSKRNLVDRFKGIVNLLEEKARALEDPR